MVTDFQSQVEEIVEAVRSASQETGVAPDSVVWGSQQSVPPCVNISAVPIAVGQQEQQVPNRAHFMEVGVFLTVEGRASERDSIPDAMRRIAPMVKAVCSLPVGMKYRGISFVDVLIDEAGKTVSSDTTMIVARFEFPFNLL